MKSKNTFKETSLSSVESEDKSGKETYHLRLKRLLGSSMWVTLRVVIQSLAAFALLTLIARLTSPELLGQYNFVIALFMAVGIVSLPGLNSAVTNNIIRGKDGSYKFGVKKSFLASLLGVPILFVIGAFYLAVKGEMTVGLTIMTTALIFPFYFAPNTWEAFLIGKKAFKKQTIYAAILFVTTTVATLLVVVLKPQLLPIIVAYLLVYALINIVFFRSTLKMCENKEVGEGIFKYGLFLTKIRTLDFVTLHLDKILIGIFLDYRDVAIYAIAIALPTFVRTSIKALANILYPEFGEFNYERIFRLFKKKLPFLFLGTGVVTVVTILAAPLFIEVFFGNQYSSSIIFSQLFALILIFAPIGNIFMTMHTYFENEATIKRATMISNSTRIVLMLILLPIWGLYGIILVNILWYASYVALYAFYPKLKKYHKSEP